MYAVAEKNFADLLTKQVYPQLMESKFSWARGTQSIAYKSLLVNNKPDAGRCKAAAAEIVKQLSGSGGVKEFGSRQPVRAELWSSQLFRGLGPVSAGGVAGPWWFEGELVKRWERNYADEAPGKRTDKVLEALRPMLAVCYDWNDMLRLVAMTPGGAGIPVLTGQGTHQPVWSANADKGRDPNLPARHDPKVVFIGGFQQVYVPFVPVQFVSNYV